MKKYHWRSTMISIFKNFWNNINGLNGLLLIVYLIFIFMTAIIVSEHFTIYFFVVSAFFIVLLTFIIAPRVLRVFAPIHICNNELSSSDKFDNHKNIIRIAFYVFPFVILLIYYIAYYPGVFTPDQVDQYSQAIRNSYNDWHPVIHTLFAFKFPLLITGGWTGSILLFQILYSSIALGYSFNVLYTHIHLKYSVFFALFVLLNPQISYIAIYPWKDISFAVGALLLVTYALQIYMTKGKWIKSPLNTAIFIITATFTSLFRHNAILFTIPLIISTLFYLTRKKGVLVCLSILFLCFSIKVPMYSMIGSEATEKRQMELLGLPMTVIGATVTYAPEHLDNDILEFAYKVAPKEVWEEKYEYGSFNHVKWDERTNNDIIEEYGSAKVVSMMFRCLKQSKMAGVTSLIKLTEVTYSISNYQNTVPIYETAPNEFRLSTGGIDRLKGILRGYSDFASCCFPHIFMCLGVLHLLLIVFALAKCRLNRIQNLKILFFILPVFINNYGITLLLTGKEDALRYFYYTYLLAPVLIAFLIKDNNESSTEKTKNH